MGAACSLGTANFTVQTKIRRPIEEVFRAIVDPQQLARYFADRADGPLEPNRTVVWHWQEWGDYPVRVIQSEPPRAIELEWNSTDWKKTDGPGFPVRVRMELESLDDGATLLKISESGWPADPAGIKGSHENCSGWTHMGLCLKAYLEHGLDLR